MIEDPKRPRSLSLDPAARKTVRDAAAAAGKRTSEYVLDLVEADDPDRHPVVLTPDEQEELRDGLREMRGFLREAQAALGERGLGLAEALRLLARERGR